MVESFKVVELYKAGRRKSEWRRSSNHNWPSTACTTASLPLWFQSQIGQHNLPPPKVMVEAHPRIRYLTIKLLAAGYHVITGLIKCSGALRCLSRINTIQYHYWHTHLDNQYVLRLQHRRRQTETLLASSLFHRKWCQPRCLDSIVSVDYPGFELSSS